MFFLDNEVTLTGLLSALLQVATFIFDVFGSCANFFITNPLFQLFIGLVAISLIISIIVYTLTKLHNRD